MNSYNFINFDLINGLKLINSNLSQLHLSIDSIIEINYISISKHFLKLRCIIDNTMQTIFINNIPEDKLCQILEFKMY